MFSFLKLTFIFLVINATFYREAFSFFSGLCPPEGIYCICTCYCMHWPKAVLSNRPFYSTSSIREEKMQIYATPNKILAIKNKWRMCLHFVRWLNTARYTQFYAFRSMHTVSANLRNTQGLTT